MFKWQNMKITDNLRIMFLPRNLTTPGANFCYLCHVTILPQKNTLLLWARIFLAPLSLKIITLALQEWKRNSTAGEAFLTALISSLQFLWVTEEYMTEHQWLTRLKLMIWHYIPEVLESAGFKIGKKICRRHKYGCNGNPYLRWQVSWAIFGGFSFNAITDLEAWYYDIVEGKTDRLIIESGL